jgi:AcrR family transcriptional regulator
MNKSDKVKSNILEAAGEIFVERGFKSATVREICKRAGVNFAAIHYHFGSKEHLYLAVLKHYQAIVYQNYPPDAGLDKTSSPETRLSAFVERFMFRILGEGQPSWFGKLVAREYADPTQALDDLLSEFFQPSFNILSSIVRELLGNKAGEQTVRLCATSIVGQCLHFRHSKAVLSRLFQIESFSKEEIKEIAQHITQFSLKALASYMDRKG